jgi:RNase P/RNase MRP subunit p30
MTMPNTSKLMRELRKRFASPAHVLRRLGLDEKLLQASVRDEHDDLSKHVRARYPARS